jgi:hypothetical protein
MIHAISTYIPDPHVYIVHTHEHQIFIDPHHYIPVHTTCRGTCININVYMFGCIDSRGNRRNFMILMKQYRSTHMLPFLVRVNTPPIEHYYVFAPIPPAFESASDLGPSAANAAMRSNAEIKILPLSALGGNKGQAPRISCNLYITSSIIKGTML